MESIWKLIAVILHLGNIEFDQHESNGESIATLSNQGSDVKTIADLIQVNPDEVKQALLTRVIAAHGEVNQYTDYTISMYYLHKSVFSEIRFRT